MQRRSGGRGETLLEPVEGGLRISDLIQPDRWAVDFSRRDEHARAAEFFRHAIVLRPNQPLLRFDYGIALFKADMLVEALGAFSEAARLKPLWDEPLRVQEEIQDKIRRRSSQSATGTLTASRSGADADARRHHRALFSPDSSFEDDIIACSDLVAAIDRLWPMHLANAQLHTFAEEHLANPAMLVAIARTASE